MGRNAAWLLVCRIAADLLSLLLFIAVSRELGPPGAGVYSYGFAIATLMFYASSLGIDEYGIREYIRRTPDMRPALMSELLGAQMTMATLAALALSIYLLLTTPDGTTLLIIVTLVAYQLCSAFAETLFVPAMAEQHMMRPAVITLVCRALATTIAAALIYSDRADLAVAMSVFAPAGGLMLWLAMQSSRAYVQMVRPRMHVAGLLTVVKTLWSFAAINAVSQLFARVGIIVLALQVGESAAGVFAAGMKLVEAGSLPLVFAGVAAYPTLCRAYADHRQFVRLTRNALVAGMAVAILIALAMYAAVPFLLVPVLGRGFAGSEAIVAAMALVVIVQGAEIVLGRLMLAANLNVARARWLAMAGVFCVIVTAVTARRYGIEAVLATLVVSYALVAVLYAITLHLALRRASAVACAH